MMSAETKPSNHRRRRIILAEDEDSLRALLQRSLERVYDVEAVADGVEALDAFDRLPADLVILDIMMPRMDGFQTCIELRRRSDVAIMMLTALVGVEDIVKGFGLGADDYITKPFTFKELAARVEAIFRRLERNQHPSPPHARQRRSTTRPDKRRVWVHSREAHLTPIEFQLLHYLMSRTGQSVTKETLFRDVWGYDFPGGTNLVEVGVRRLREKIEDNPSNPQMIQTLRGAGYRFRLPPGEGS